MIYFYCILTGSILQLIGTFFVSVNYFGIEKFRNLKIKIFSLFNHSISYKSNKFRLPLVKEYREFINNKRSGFITITQEERIAFKRVFYYYWYTHYFGGFIGTIIILVILKFFEIDFISYFHGELFPKTPLIWAYLVVAFFFIFSVWSNYEIIRVFVDRWAGTHLPIFVFTLFSLPTIYFILVGELIHLFLVMLLKISFAIVEFIYRETPDGTLGKLSFLLIFLGTILQIVGTWYSMKSG